jgi:outer membrane protein assembly factor BamB
MPPFTRSAVSLALALAASGAAAPAAAQDWPSFRGAHAAGVATGTPPVSWDVTATRNVAWRTPLPGLAHSSPIVWADRVYVTTAVSASGAPTVRTGDSSRAGIGAAPDMVGHTWTLIALDKASGKIVWSRAVHQGVPRVKRHVKASHASSTPATNGRAIVALFDSEGLFCFGMDGTLKWRKDLGVIDVGLVDDPTYQWGPASSPVIDGTRVIVQVDRHKDGFIAAFDLESGKEVWRTRRDELPTWSTPLVVRTSSRAEIVTNGGKYLRGYDAATGRELWRLADEATQVKVPSPVAAGDLVIVTGGYPAGGRPIYALRPGGAGDLAPSAIAWRTDNGSPYTGTPLVYDGIVYICTDNGILSAYDAKTGERIYRSRVSPAAAGFSASPVAAAGRLYLASEDGDVFVVKAGRTFELLATNPMGEICMATPAISGDMLIVRTQGHLVGMRDSG